MLCPACNTFLDEDTFYCGNCGRQVRPLRAKGETLNNLPVGGLNDSVSAQPRESFQTVLANEGSGQRTQPALAPIASTQGQIPTILSSPEPRPPLKRRKTALAGILVLLLTGVTAFTLAVVHHSGTLSAVATNASGQVTFLDSPAGFGNTDALKISLTGLSAPQAGSQYDAWLIDTDTEQVTALGALKETGTTFSLNFTSSSQNGQPGPNLLGLGNQITVTKEQGRVSLPSGSILLSATFPPKAFIHIKHLLFSFPTPTKIGLLVGLFGQTKLLSGQAQVLQAVSNSRNTQGQECIAQSILDIIEGQSGPDYSQLPASCMLTTAMGDGFGILGYASTTAIHAALAASQTDSTALIRQRASEIEVATTNITNWVKTIQSDSLKLLNGQTSQAAVDEIATLAEKTNLGFDANGNGQIEPLPGEAGAATAYSSGQHMATLSLTVPSAT